MDEEDQYVNDSLPIWQDREIRFDVPDRYLMILI